MTREEELLEAARRALQYFRRQVEASQPPNGQHEDQLCGEHLARVLRLYEDAPTKVGRWVRDHEQFVTAAADPRERR